MLQTWFNMLYLAAEAQEVIGLRMLKLVGGGAAAQDEAFLMVAEKYEAGCDAFVALLSGATPDGIVSAYREEVQANAARLLRRD